MRRAIPLAVLLALVLVQPATAQRAARATSVASASPVSASTDFDAFVEGLMQEWNVPGVAVGVIKDGHVAILGGYGLRDIEARLPVTPQTLMAIGSNSKSFTVVLMAQLVEEGKLDWDEPVRSYLPDFQLYDDYATEHMRVKDLVSHVSGLPRHDALWYGRSLDRDEIFTRLEHLEPTTSFRGRYQYQNLMFMTAGYLVERITGRSWDDLIHEQIFGPLQMARSNTSVTDTPASGDFAYPYLSEDGELKRVPFRNIDNVGPAGSINSSVEEMLRYIQMHIDRGEWEGTRILSEDDSELMQSPHSVASADMPDPELGPTTYGLALRVSSYRGHKWVQHGGGIDGFISAMAWLPNDDIGVMVLTNMSGATAPNPVPDLVVRRVFDDLLGLEPIDWNARIRERAAEAAQTATKEEEELRGGRVEGTSPSHALEAYVGSYSHPSYGTVQVALERGMLQVTFDTLEFSLRHFHYDVFDFDAGAGVVSTGQAQFRMNKSGEIDALLLPLEPALPDIVFERMEI